MTTYADAKTRKPSHVVTLQPGAFADEWELKPQGPVAMGLRLLSEGDSESVTVAASQHILERYHDDQQRPTVEESVLDEVYNARIMVYGVARAICEPDNALANHRLFPFPETQIEAGALTAETVKYLWEQLGLLRLKLSPIAPQASDAEAATLGALLGAGVLAKMPPGPGGAVRRLLAEADALLRKHLSNLPTAPRRLPVDEDEDEDDGVVTYRARSA